MEKLKVGILGLRRGITHIHNFLAVQNAEVIGACDWYQRNRDRAAFGRWSLQDSERRGYRIPPWRHASGAAHGGVESRQAEA